MPSILTQKEFDVLGITNGGWLAPVNNPRGGNGTTGHDDMIFNNILSGLLVDGMGGNDRITLQDVNLGIASIINGGAGSDQIFGNNAILNTIDGGDGNDYIHGGAGVDRLSGGAGVNGGFDTLSYESSDAAVTVNMGQLTLGNITVSGGHANGDIVSNNFENVVGSAFNDTITGNGGVNKLIGLGGNDRLNGGGGDDILMGGAGDDTLTGGAGNDRIIGGVGQDTLTGGDGADIFVYESTVDADDDDIDEFQNNVDKIDLSAIDADTTQSGNQAFFLNDDATDLTGHAGELIISISRGPTGSKAAFLMGDTNGDGNAEFVILVGDQDSHPKAGDFIL